MSSLDLCSAEESGVLVRCVESAVVAEEDAAGVGEWCGVGDVAVDEHVEFAVVVDGDGDGVAVVGGWGEVLEVEHTTAIYSGILRMADLLALQPNMDINLHIVAPEERRDKVFEQLRRPVFSLLEQQPLAEVCSFLSYEKENLLLQRARVCFIKAQTCWVDRMQCLVFRCRRQRK